MKSRLLYLFVALTMVIGLLPGTVPVLATTAEVPAVLPMAATTTPPPAIQWTKTFGGAGDDRGLGVAQTSDGGYIISGLTNSFGTGGWDAYLIRTDSAGIMTWSKTLGGGAGDETWPVRRTSDGGYIVIGYTESSGAGFRDVWLIKTDSAGNVTWDRTFGGTGDDRGYSGGQTSDGGYIIGGLTSSFGAGSYDFYLIKTDSSGNMIWSKTFGGTGGDEGRNVQQTADGGYIMSGFTNSFGAGSYDVYVIKTDSSGNMTWGKTFGGTAVDTSEGAQSIQQTRDGGYIISGWTSSSGAGSEDVYLIKTDSSGNMLWGKTFGGAGNDRGSSVQQTPDGYVIAGLTNSFGAGSSDGWLVKTDSSGNMTWSQTFGGTGDDGLICLEPTSDGGYVIIGYTTSYGAGSRDVWLIKLGPETTAPAAPTGLTKISPDNNPLPAFKWDASANATSYEVRIDSGNWTDIGDRLTYVQPTVLSKGDHTFSVRAKDASGSVSIETSLSFNVSVVADLANTKIAFASDRDGNYEIYVMNIDGTGLTRLTNNTVYDLFPAWSPDGTKIAFASGPWWDAEIYVINADGSNLTRLTNNAANDVYPAWSPDGMKIAFNSNRDHSANWWGNIFIMNADGTNQTKIPMDAAYESEPAWSPDGTKIVFTRGNSDAGGSFGGLWVMNTDGSGKTLLPSPTSAGHPDWSPDGSKITVTGDKGYGTDWGIFVMNADGTSQTLLTNDAQKYTGPDWAPDGSRIAHELGPDGNTEIYTMNPDGSSPTRLTFNSIADIGPDWAPFLPEPTDLVSIAVMPIAPTVILGLTQQFTATGFYSDNSTADLTATATWTSSNTSVVTINSAGLATALAAGTATISATSGSSISGNTTLTVIIATMVTVNNGSAIKLAPGQIISASGAGGIPVAVKNLPNLGAPANGLAAFTFNFSWNPAVIRVDSVFGATAAQMAGWNIFSGTPNNTNGTVTATGFTTTYSTADVILLYLGITAAGSLGDNATITVSITDLGDKDANPIPATPVNAPVQISLPTLLSIAVTPANPSIALGQTQQFTATGFYSDNSTADLTATATWTSSNTSVATISATGLATSLAQGTTPIRATLGSIIGSTTLTVTAPVLAAPTVTTNNATGITSNSAVLNGTLTSLGTATMAIVSFQWRISSGNYTTANETIPAVGFTIGNFSETLSGLSGNTTYYFRAKAVGDGTSYGVEKSFTTLTLLPGDANGDGKVNAIDITKVERIIAGLDSPTPGADANQDGNINALDITKVEKIIVGLG